MRICRAISQFVFVSSSSDVTHSVTSLVEDHELMNAFKHVQLT